MLKEEYKEAHKNSSNHKEKLMKDKICGCFYCLSIFSPTEIVVWVPDINGTALCPYCGIDSIIGESSGYPISSVFLRGMYRKFFGQGTTYGPDANGECMLKARYYEKNDKEFRLMRHSKISNFTRTSLPY